MDKCVGETNYNELRVTTLDPKTRDIIKVNLDTQDLEDADNITDVLFNKNRADMRKDFIQERLSHYIVV